MPLQKPRSHGTTIVDVQVPTRWQLQERRRTLQTISELSATGTVHPDFKTATNKGTTPTSWPDIPPQGPKASVSHKRRSLPQHYARPECVQTQSPPPIPSTHPQSTQHASSRKAASVTREAGWNARRELARQQAEEALSGTSGRREQSIMPDPKLPPTLLKLSSVPRAKPSQPYLKSYYSQQHLLRNSCSMSNTTSRLDQGLSSGLPPRDTSRDVEPSDRTSTDSRSFRSSRDSTIRRSRSSSSSQSFTLQGVPPLPSGCAQPINVYYSTLHSPYHSGYPIQLPGPMYAQGPPEMRTTCLPYMTAASLPRHSYTGVHTALSSHPPQKQHGRLRPKSLSTQPSSRHQQPLVEHPSQSSIKSHPRRHSTHHKSAPPTPPTPSPQSQRRRSTSSLKVPPRAHVPPRSASSETKRTPAALPPRPVPDRSSLAKWKCEREDARAELDGMQRAKVQERVRRANEMERERERELQMVGKGAEKGMRVLGVGLREDGGKKSVRGCLGAWVGRVMGRWKE